MSLLMVYQKQRHIHTLALRSVSRQVDSKRHQSLVSLIGTSSNAAHPTFGSTKKQNYNYYRLETY